MADITVEQAPLLSLEIQKHVRKTQTGKIRTKALGMYNRAVSLTLVSLAAITVVAFLTFNYKQIDFWKAVADTLHNVGIVFFQPKLTSDTIPGILNALLTTFCLGLLTTFFGAILAFFASLLCAKNIANPKVATVVKSIMAFIRAIPTILWVLIFAVSAGLGAVAAVSGLTFHSMAYLTKAYSESIEEMEPGTIEALKASGAGFFQIVTQAIVPSSISYMVAWTFMRFEINFINAIAMGAAAGAGGIGYNLFMAGSFYLDLKEMGFLTYVIVLTVILLEVAATRIKAKVK